ncbi:hypothetical protein IKF94_02380 [Candidatus Saccharibacteria bacterium]|nr:hypothetical protein [Candidatus Saccharibacteria bacterium]
MSSISSIILPIYQKYTPKFAKISGKVDLGVKDPSLSVKNPKKTEVAIISLIIFILKETKSPHLIIQSTDKYLIIKEENTLLEPDFKAKLSELEGAKVSSRIGFGTSIKFPLL